MQLDRNHYDVRCIEFLKNLVSLRAEIGALIYALEKGTFRFDTHIPHFMEEVEGCLFATEGLLEDNLIVEDEDAPIGGAKLN